MMNLISYEVSTKQGRGHPSHSLPDEEDRYTGLRYLTPARNVNLEAASTPAKSCVTRVHQTGSRPGRAKTFGGFRQTRTVHFASKQGVVVCAEQLLASSESVPVLRDATITTARDQSWGGHITQLVLSDDVALVGVTLLADATQPRRPADRSCGNDSRSIRPVVSDLRRFPEQQRSRLGDARSEIVAPWCVPANPVRAGVPQLSVSAFRATRLVHTSPSWPKRMLATLTGGGAFIAAPLKSHSRTTPSEFIETPRNSCLFGGADGGAPLRPVGRLGPDVGGSYR